MVVGVGPPATQNREPGQAWKGAAAAVEAGAGVWLAQAAAPHLGSAIAGPGGSAPIGCRAAAALDHSPRGTRR
jgi:hypothetical protein